MHLSALHRSLRETFPTRASEWAVGLMLFNWSLVLTFNDGLFIGRESYSMLAAIAPQSWWAAACLTIGGGRLIVLGINGMWRRTPHLRAAGAFLSCFFWFEIAVGMAASGVWATGMAIYPVLFLLDVYNAMRVANEAGRTDRYWQRATRHVDT